MGGFLMTCVRISALPFICRKEGSIVNGRIPCDLRAHQRASFGGEYSPNNYTTFSPSV